MKDNYYFVHNTMAKTIVAGNVVNESSLDRVKATEIIMLDRLGLNTIVHDGRNMVYRDFCERQNVFTHPRREATAINAHPWIHVWMRFPVSAKRHQRHC